MGDSRARFLMLSMGLVLCVNLCTVARFGLLHQKLKSSVNKFAFTGYSMLSEMSFIANRNSFIDSNEPWSTPFFVLNYPKVCLIP